MNTIKRLQLLAGFLVLIGRPALASSDTLPDTNKCASMPYSQIYSILQTYPNKEITSHVNIRATIHSVSNVPTTNIVLYINSTNGCIPVVVDSTGGFEFPQNDKLLKENPLVVANQPKGSLDLTVGVMFVKNSDKNERIKYSEVMMPITMGLALAEQQGVKDWRTLRVEGLWLRSKGYKDRADRLRIKSKAESPDITPGTNGLMFVPFVPSLFIEDPLIEFPSSVVSLAGLKSGQQPKRERTTLPVTPKPSKEDVQQQGENVNTWLTYYYTFPQAHTVPAMLENISIYGLFENDTAQLPLMGFLAVLLQKNPDIVPDVLQTSLNLRKDLSLVVWSAVWLVDTPSARDQLKAIAAECGSLDELQIEMFLSKKPFKIEKEDIESANELDTLWGAFFASGDRKYVDRIASFLPWAMEEKDEAKLLIGGAARWSLASNAVQHPEVLKICKDLSKSDSLRKERKLLEMIVAEAEGKQPKTDISKDIIEKLRRMAGESKKK